jgi:hypothetical protein
VDKARYLVDAHLLEGRSVSELVCDRQIAAEKGFAGLHVSVKVHRDGAELAERRSRGKTNHIFVIMIG